MLFLLSGPEKPEDDDDELHGGGDPQDAGSPDGAPSQHAAQDGADEEQDGGADPAVTLGVAGGQDLGVGEEVAVDAGEDDAGEGVVPERAAGDGLAAALEGDERDGHEHRPVDVFFSGVLVLRAEGQDRGGAGDEEHLQRERRAQDPAPLGRRREEPVQGAEEDGADAEAAERRARLDPPRRLVRRREAEPEVHRISCPHRVS